MLQQVDFWCLWNSVLAGDEENQGTVEAEQVRSLFGQ